MNTKNLWTSALLAAVLTTTVSNLPFVDLINCLMFAGFWGSALFGVWLYRRLSGTVTVSQGLAIGALTGICAGVTGFALSFVDLAGAQGLLRELRAFVPPEALPGTQDIPFSDLLAFNLVGVLFNIVFGIIGGWIGGALFRTDRRTVMQGA